VGNSRQRIKGVTKADVVLVACISKLNLVMNNLMTYFTMNSICQKASVFATGAVLSCIVINANAANAVSLYTITELTPNNLRSTAVDINNLDQVIVRADGSSFLWENGSMEEFDTPPGYTSISPKSINDAGQVVGSANILYYNYSISFAVIWPNNTIIDTDFRVLTHAFNSTGVDINNNGQILVDAEGLGTFLVQVDPSGHVISERNIIPEEPYLYTLGLNDIGQVIGNGFDGDGPVPFIWENDVITTGLGFGYGTPTSINNAGQVVGCYVVTYRYPNCTAALWDDGNSIRLDTEDSKDSEALDINDNGLIVGRVYSSFFDPVQTSYATLWQDGEMFDLNNLIGPNSDSFDTLVTATAINNNGLIIGQGRVNNQTRAFLATPILEPTPVPEPSTILGLGLLGLASLTKYKLGKPN
jgi:uncharacterized membrane protein